jgi:hypothetical protein
MSQLVNALIVIITTIITVRVTQSGSLGISKKFKTRLKMIALRYILVFAPLVMLIFVTYLLSNYLRRTTPIERSDVFYISLYTVMLAYWIDELQKGVIYVWRNRHSRDNTDPPRDQ